MSKILNDIASNSISLTECLQRLLIIATKTNNKELAEWCEKELNGYKKEDEIPDYRKFNTLNIVFSGICGRLQLTNQPIQPGYLSEKTLDQLKTVLLFENISEVEKRKDQDDSLSRDLTFLSGEVYKNTQDDYTGIGVQCTSIRQLIPTQLYGEIYSAVKTRIINLLCYYDMKRIDLDNLDIPNRKVNSEEDSRVYNQIIVQGSSYSSVKAEKRIMWNIIIPILTAIVSGVITGVLVYLITNVWMK